MQIFREMSLQLKKQQFRLTEATGVEQRRDMNKLQSLTQTERGKRQTLKRTAKKRKNVSCSHIHLWLNTDFLHPNSAECTKSKLDLFSVPVTQKTT